MGRVFAPRGERSRTHQSFKEPSEMRAIMRKYLSSGDPQVLLQKRPESARYGDFTTDVDYLSALSKVREAERLFMELPSSVRDHVDNDPAELLRLVNDPERREECEKIGLIPRASVSAGGVTATGITSSESPTPPASSPGSPVAAPASAPSTPEGGGTTTPGK